jgi:hypothetical protein
VSPFRSPGTVSVSAHTGRDRENSTEIASNKLIAKDSVFALVLRIFFILSLACTIRPKPDKADTGTRQALFTY